MTTTANRDLNGTTDITEIGQHMWSYLTGKGASVEYIFEDMSIEVPKRTGADSPSAIWKLNGTLRIRTSDDEASGAARGA